MICALTGRTEKMLTYPPALPAQQDMQTPMAEAPAFACQLLQAATQTVTILLAGFILPGRKIEFGQAARPALTEAMRPDQMRNHFPIAGWPHHFRPTALRAHRCAMPSMRRCPGGPRPEASSAWRSPPRALSDAARQRLPSGNKPAWSEKHDPEALHRRPATFAGCGLNRGGGLSASVSDPESRQLEAKG